MYLQIGTKEDIEFLEINNKHFYDDVYVEKDGYIATFYLRYDSQYNTYERRIYSILDLLGDIGGLYSSLYFLGYFLIGFINHRLFISAILRQLY